MVFRYGPGSHDVPTFTYDAEELRLASDLDDSIEALERLRDWAADERRAGLLPPLLHQHAERLVRPNARGQPPLPKVLLAAFAFEWDTTPRPRTKTLAARYQLANGTVSRWVSRARDRGLLDDVGRLTDDARRLLDTDGREPAEIIRSWLARRLPRGAS